MRYGSENGWICRNVCRNLCGPSGRSVTFWKLHFFKGSMCSSKKNVVGGTHKKIVSLIPWCHTQIYYKFRLLPIIVLRERGNILLRAYK